MYTCTYVKMYMYICMHVHMYICVCVHMYMCKCIDVYICPVYYTQMTLPTILRGYNPLGACSIQKHILYHTRCNTVPTKSNYKNRKKNA